VATAAYSLVELPGGRVAVHAEAYGEAMHPGLGPAAEAETLHVGQLKLRERLGQHSGEFVVWDVGLGAAANALAALRALRALARPLRLVSFDNTLAPLAFALEHAEALGYLRGYETVVGKVLADRSVEFVDGARTIRWQVWVDDFPKLLADNAAANLPKPDAIFFDAFSPARNPAMWTLPVFESLFRLLDPQRACALTTYSRSTMVRVAMLLAGFFVGRGRPSGAKEETTVAANRLGLLDEPLDAAWLQRVRRSGSAEPLHDARYRQAPLSEAAWARLQEHPQFVSGQAQAGAEFPPPAGSPPRR
jgi:queuine tRNA-ribosyltransferase